MAARPTTARTAATSTTATGLAASAATKHAPAEPTSSARCIAYKCIG